MAEGKLPRRFVDLELGLLFGSGRGILGRNITQNSLLDPQSSTGGVRRDRPKLRSESARDVNKRALVCALLFDSYQFLSYVPCSIALHADNHQPGYLTYCTARSLA